MDANAITQFMSAGGLWILALIIFLEYLNLPSFSAEIILPVADIWAKTSDQSILITILVSTASAMLASWILYALGTWGGDFLVEKFATKYPKQTPMLDKGVHYLREKGSGSVFGKTSPYLANHPFRTTQEKCKSNRKCIYYVWSCPVLYSSFLNVA